MKKILFWWLAILLLGVLLGYGVSWFFQQPQQSLATVPIVVAEEIPVWETQLYFTALSGDYLVPEVYNIPTCDADVDCIRKLVDGLIAGSQDNNNTLPSQAKVLGVELDNDLVKIDFSHHFVDFHPGGSLSELLTIYSLANSLNENFPYIRQLQITVAGKIRQTLKGHARIDQPIYADYSYSEPPLVEMIDEPAEKAVAAEDLSIEKILQMNADGNKE